MSKERLTYHLPALGNAALTLQDESAGLYRFLELSGEVARLNKLDHLGLVRVAWSGAHHPRWEYVVTILHLIERCKDATDIHLNTRVQVGDGEISSGAELLRCWALLSNVGHLHETFSAEASFLEEVARSRAARQAFLGEFSTEAAREWAERLVSDRRIYSFFQALTFIRLRGLSEAVALPAESLKSFEDIFFTYVLGGGDDQLVLLKRVYRNLRRLAYLGLDGHYVPAVIGLDLHQVASDIPAFTRLVIRDDASATQDDELRALEQYLYREFYMGRTVLAATAARDRRLREAIRRSLRSNGFRETLELLARNGLQEAVVAEELECVVRLAGWSSSDLTEIIFEEIDIRKRRTATARDRRADSLGVRAIWWEAAYGRDWVLQTHAPPGRLDSAAYAFAVAFREAVAVVTGAYDRWQGVVDTDILHALASERHAMELIEAALNLVFKAEMRWEWRRLRGDTTAVLLDRASARRRMRRYMSRVDVSRSRADELRAISVALRRRPNQFAAVTAVNLLGYAGLERSPAVELDGAVVEVLSDRLRLTLIEAKRQRSGAEAAAVRQLQRSVRTLVTRAKVLSGSVASGREGRFGYAQISFEIPFPTEG